MTSTLPKRTNEHIEEKRFATRSSSPDWFPRCWPRGKFALSLADGFRTVALFEFGLRKIVKFRYLSPKTHFCLRVSKTLLEPVPTQKSVLRTSNWCQTPSKCDHRWLSLKVGPLPNAGSARRGAGNQPSAGLERTLSGSGAAGRLNVTAPYSPSITPVHGFRRVEPLMIVA